MGVGVNGQLYVQCLFVEASICYRHTISTCTIHVKPVCVGASVSYGHISTNTCTMHVKPVSLGASVSYGHISTYTCSMHVKPFSVGAFVSYGHISSHV